MQILLSVSAAVVLFARHRGKVCCWINYSLLLPINRTSVWSLPDFFWLNTLSEILWCSNSVCLFGLMSVSFWLSLSAAPDRDLLMVSTLDITMDRDFIYVGHWALPLKISGLFLRAGRSALAASCKAPDRNQIFWCMLPGFLSQLPNAAITNYEMEKGLTWLQHRRIWMLWLKVVVITEVIEGEDCVGISAIPSFICS